MLKTTTFVDAEAAQEAAIKLVNAQLAGAKKAGRAILLLLSGGSNLTIARGIEKELLTQTYLLPLDERFSADPKLNNGLLLQEVGIPVQLLLPKDTDTLQSTGAIFNSLLSNWLEANPNGFVLATLGMGLDGHIAGISPMPNSPSTFQTLFQETADLAVGYVGELQPPARITVTYPLLERIDTIVATILGVEKKKVLARAEEPGASAHQLPIHGILSHPGLHVLTD